MSLLRLAWSRQALPIVVSGLAFFALAIAVASGAVVLTMALTAVAVFSFGAMSGSWISYCLSTLTNTRGAKMVDIVQYLMLISLVTAASVLSLAVFVGGTVFVSLAVLAILCAVISGILTMVASL